MKKKSRDGKLWELVDDIYWHKPDKAFDFVVATGRQCDRVQVLIPIKFPKLWVRGFRSPASLTEDGAESHVSLVLGRQPAISSAEGSPA